MNKKKIDLSNFDFNDFKADALSQLKSGQLKIALQLAHTHRLIDHIPTDPITIIIFYYIFF